MAIVELIKVNKIYQSFNKKNHVIKNINLKINDGEFIVLVGPSGCGKSTILRMIAGLEEITSGEIKINGKIVNNIEPQHRKIAMVFQSYALYPHLTVFKNISFPLELKKIDKKTIEKKVNEVAEFLDLKHLLNRTPKQLSGGQRQRVAIGRALVRKPEVFLFDEPLSNLDAKLRVEMRVEILKLHKKLKTNFIYVTHDQVEAMTLGDKIAVLHNGILQQFASPLEIYNYPANRFVAGFIGTPSMNFFMVDILKENNDLYIITKDFKIKIPDKYKPYFSKYKKNKVIFGIRSKDIYLKESHYKIEKNKNNMIRGKFIIKEELGNEILYYIKVSSMMENEEGQKKNLILSSNISINYSTNSDFECFVDQDKFYFFDPDTEKSILEIKGNY